MAIRIDRICQDLGVEIPERRIEAFAFLRQRHLSVLSRHTSCPFSKPQDVPCRNSDAFAQSGHFVNFASVSMGRDIKPVANEIEVINKLIG